MGITVGSVGFNLYQKIVTGGGGNLGYTRWNLPGNSSFDVLTNRYTIASYAFLFQILPSFFPDGGYTPPPIFFRPYNFAAGINSAVPQLSIRSWNSWNGTSYDGIHGNPNASRQIDSVDIY